MKKILLCAIIALLSFSASARGAIQDQSKPKCAIRYQGEASLGYMFSLYATDRNMVEVHTVHGIRVGDYFSVGIGVGIDMTGYESYSYEQQKVQLNITPMIPLYLNVKGYLPVSKGTRLYLSMDAGMVFDFESGAIDGLSSRAIRTKVLSVAYLNPAFGANIKVSPKNAINLSVGYKTYLSNRAMVNGINVRIGFQF